MLYPYISFCLHTRASIHKHATMLWFVVIVYIHKLAMSHVNYLLMAAEIQWIVWHFCNVQLAWLMFLLVYDSVMTMPWLGNPFRISCTLNEEITPGWLIPLTKGQMRRYNVFVDVSHPTKLLNKQSNYWRFKTLWRSCHCNKTVNGSCGNWRCHTWPALLTPWGPVTPKCQYHGVRHSIDLRQYGTKPLLHPMLTCCQLDSKEQLSLKFYKD